MMTRTSRRTKRKILLVGQDDDASWKMDEVVVLVVVVGDWKACHLIMRRRKMYELMTSLMMDDVFR